MSEGLVQRIVDAMTEAIHNQETALTCDAGRLASVTLELELSNVGAVIDSRCYIERRGVHRTKAKKGAAA